MKSAISFADSISTISWCYKLHEMGAIKLLSFVFLFSATCAARKSVLKDSLLPPPTSVIINQQRINAHFAHKYAVLSRDTTELPAFKCGKDTVKDKVWKISPILPNEVKKFASLSFMLFWTVFIFTLTRDTKDTLIVTNCGAESIAFLKVYGVIPAVTAFTIIYTRLAHKHTTRELLPIILKPFYIFYIIFGFLIYPLRNTLHLNSIVTPNNGLQYLVNLLKYWTFSLYFIISEVFGSASIPLLFWSCANEVIRIDQAKRMYPLLALLGNMGPILAGVTSSAVTKLVQQYMYLTPTGPTNSINAERSFEISLQILTLAMVATGGVILKLHKQVYQIHEEEIAILEAEKSRLRLEKERIEQENARKTQQIHRNSTMNLTQSSANKSGFAKLVEILRLVLRLPLISTANVLSSDSMKAITTTANNTKEITSPLSVYQITNTTQTLSKAKATSQSNLTLYESFSILYTDKYLRNIATIVLSYGLSIEFTEIMWKALVKQALPSKTEYLNFMGRYSTLMGISSVLMMITGSAIMSRFGWFYGALTTPIVMTVTSVPFFAFLILKKSVLKETRYLLMAVYIGLLQNILSKSTKYSVFDPSKEMAYMPLDKQSKVACVAFGHIVGLCVLCFFCLSTRLYHDDSWSLIVFSLFSVCSSAMTNGKAAIDVLVARLGKSGGAFLLQIITLIFGSLVSGAPVLATLFVGTIAVWIVAIFQLAPQFEAKTNAAAVATNDLTMLTTRGDQQQQ